MPATLQFIFTSAISAITAGLIMLFFSSTVSRFFKRSDEWQQAITARLDKMDAQMELIHKEFSAIQIDSIREFASKDEITENEKKNTAAHGSFWTEINPVKERLAALEREVNLGRRKK